MPERPHKSINKAAVSTMDVQAVQVRLRTLLPSSIAVSVQALDSLTRVQPEEERYISGQRMHPNREREFRAGRGCAQQALGRLGYHDVAVLPGADREPLWPSGVVGSITHSRQLAAAAVAWGGKFSALGIDVEELGAGDDTVEAMIMSAQERQSRPQAMPADIWRMLHFSAKESVFKASFPRARIFFEFQDIELKIDVENGAYRVCTAAALQLGVPGDLQGRWAVCAAHVVTVAFAVC